MQSLPFQQVDVFTNQHFKGNPVAVVLEGDGLSSSQMQQIAHWTNLSETTFVLTPTAPGADYRLRIFTPGAELPFAGHPTIGTAHALLEAGRVHARNGKLTQQCQAGLIDVRVDEAAEGGRDIAFTLPAPAISALEAGELAQLAGLLGTHLAPGFTPLLVDVGARWVLVQLLDAAAVLAVTPDFAGLTTLDAAGRRTGVVVFGPYPEGAAADYEMRAFAPAHGINEDPVCGSGSGCLGAYLRHTGQVTDADLRLSQGQVVMRDGRIRLGIRPDAITVGGHAVTCIDGTIRVQE
jgi:PhzF family phenazine biosynthesis protein